MRSGLDQKSRAQVVQNYNTKGGLQILIVMYHVGVQSINRQTCCHFVIVATPTVSCVKFLQVIGRVIRVSPVQN